MTTITIEIKKGMVWIITANTQDIDIQILDHDNGDTEFMGVAPDSVMTDKDIAEYILKANKNNA